MGKRVNKKELAEILGVSERTLTDWQNDDGLPIIKDGQRGEANEYDTEQVIAWKERRALDKVSTPKARLELELLELSVREKRAADGIREKTLVPAHEVEPIWSTRVMTAAAYQMSRASRLAGILEAMPGIEAKREIIKKEDAEFLTRLGSDGGRMQRELEELLEKVSAEEAAAFLRRIAAHDQQRSVEPADGGMGAADPAQES